MAKTWLLRSVKAQSRGFGWCPFYGGGSVVIDSVLIGATDVCWGFVLIPFL